MNAMRNLITTTAVLFAMSACTAERPHDNSKMPDAGSDDTDKLTAPILSDVPVSTPLDTVAIRGNTDGASIVVTSDDDDPVVRSVLPSGAFCADVPVTAADNSLLVFALKDGVISEGVRVNVKHDPNAPQPQSPRCLGMEQPACVAEDNNANNCGDGQDNNCNGFSDECETACNGCQEDGFGPNYTPYLVPMIAPGTYQLSICPCHSDYFAFSVPAGQMIHVKATFNTSNIDLDMKLQVPTEAENNTPTAVAQSIGTTGVEEISWPAASSGVYYLHVYPFGANQAGSYTLTIF